MDRDELERRLAKARQLGATDAQINAKRQQMLASGRITQPSLGSKIAKFGGEVVRPITDFGRMVGVGAGVAGAGLVGAGAKGYEALTGNKTNVDEKALGLANLLYTKGLTPRQQTNLAPTASTGQVVGEGARTGMGVGSFLVPGGKTLKSALGLGAISGGLYGADRGDKFSAGNVVGGALGGAAGGAAYRAVGALRNLPGKVGGGTVGKDAVQAYNKASPSMYEKAVSEHGLDVNKLTRKYVGSGMDYDTMLGGAAERGKGGVLGNKFNQAEKTITDYIDLAGKDIRIPVSDLTKGLRSELGTLKKIPGNEKNIQELLQLIKATEKSYKNGFTAKQLLQLKRVADSKFGKAVTDETTGSVTAQFQKMLANSSRATLKKYFKQVGGALDQETEIYTLRPILERARGTLNTQGSTIRQGQLANVSVTSPFSVLNLPNIAFNNSPKFASRIFNLGGKEAVKDTAKKGLSELLPTSTRPFVGDIPAKVGAGLGATIATPEYHKQEQYPTYGNTYQKQEGSYINSQTNHTQSINPQVNKVQSGPISFWEAQKYGKQMDSMWVVSPDSKTIWNPRTRKWIPFDKSQMPKPQTKADIDGKMDTLLQMHSQLPSSGQLGGRLSGLAQLLGDPNTAAYEAASSSLAVEIAAAMGLKPLSEAEVAEVRKKWLPSPLDTYEQADAKIRALKNLISLSAGNSTTTTQEGGY